MCSSIVKFCCYKNINCEQLLLRADTPVNEFWDYIWRSYFVDLFLAEIWFFKMSGSPLVYTIVFEIINLNLRCEMFCGMSPLSVLATGTIAVSPVPALFSSRLFSRRPVTGISSLTCIAVNGVNWTVIFTLVAGTGLEIACSGFQVIVPPQVPVAGTFRKLPQVPVEATSWSRWFESRK